MSNKNVKEKEWKIIGEHPYNNYYDAGFQTAIDQAIKICEDYILRLGKAEEEIRKHPAYNTTLIYHQKEATNLIKSKLLELKKK